MKKTKLVHLLLVCAVAYVGSVQIYEVCPGSAFYLPRPPQYEPQSSVLSLTPQSGSAQPVLLLNRTEPTDERFQFRNGTLFISELREEDAGTLSWERDGKAHTILQLAMKDCAELKHFRVGESMRLAIPSEAAVLEFEPASSPGSREVMWTSAGGDVGSGGSDAGSDASAEPKTYARRNLWYVDMLVPTDSGSYTFRRKSGAELSKTRLSVTAGMYYFNFERQREWHVYVPVASLTELSLVCVRKVDQVSGEADVDMWLYRDGIVTMDFYQTFGGRPRFHEAYKYNGRMFSFEALTSDAGTYRILDTQKRLLALVILDTDPPERYSPYWWLLVVGAVLVVLVGLCVCNCKSKAKANTNSNYQPCSVEMQPAAT